jgi:exodeoxyribonuclease VII small subunit
MAKKKAASQISYEDAFKELQAIVLQLESGDLPLEEALALFERGQEMASHCTELLQKAELKLRQLVPDDSGEFVTLDLELDEEP